MDIGETTEHHEVVLGALTLAVGPFSVPTLGIPQMPVTPAPEDLKPFFWALRVPTHR